MIFYKVTSLNFSILIWRLYRKDLLAFNWMRGVAELHGEKCPYRWSTPNINLIPSIITTAHPLQDFQLAWFWSQVAIYSDLSTKKQLLSTITIPVTKVCNDKTNFQGARTPCAKFMTEPTSMTITTAQCSSIAKLSDHQCSSIAKLSDRQCSFSSYYQLSPSWCLASWFSASAVTRYNCLLTKQTNFKI